MNITHENPPRLVCRMARIGTSIFGSAGQGPGANHVAQCADCQAYFSEATELDFPLPREARTLRATPSPGFEQRIANGVPPPPRPAAERRVPPTLLALAGLGVA